MGLKSHFKKTPVTEVSSEKILLIEGPAKETFYKTVFFAALILGFALGEFCEVKLGVVGNAVKILSSGLK